MQTDALIRKYWRCVVRQDDREIWTYLRNDAVVRWHNTNEQFTAAEFVRVNCAYPGAWRGEVERIEQTGQIAVAAAHIWSEAASFHVTSFFLMQDGKIAEIDEYWGDDSPSPGWRQDMRIGRPIR